MNGQQRLKTGEFHLVTLGLPLPIDIAAEIMMSVSQIAQKHGYDSPVLLTDGSNRIIARKHPRPSAEHTLEDV